jgi:hypothetical protein
LHCDERGVAVRGNPPQSENPASRIFFFLKFPCKIFHKSRKICKMGMGKYPPGELVIPVDSGTIGFSSKAENA